MHHSKLPLTAWFWAAYLMATHSNGISALQLQRQLAFGSYIEFQQRFGDEAACAQYLVAARWPDGLSAHAAGVAKPGGWKPRPGPMSAPAIKERGKSAVLFLIVTATSKPD